MELISSTVTLLPIRLTTTGRELARCGVPVVDPRLFVPTQDAADFFRDPGGAGRLRLEQPGEHLTHLRRRQGRDFPPPSRSFSRIRNHNANSDSVMWWRQPTQLRIS
jgi:hypothetical protein